MDTAARFRGLMRALFLGAMGFSLVPAGAFGQVRERDVTITGPRGRTIQRQMETRVGPNGITRDLSVTRPGGTLQRETIIGGRPMFGPGPRPPVFLRPNVFVGGGGPGISPLASFGLGAALGTGAGVLLDRTVLAPPPPVMVAPAPVVVGAPPVVVGGSPGYVQPPVVYSGAAPVQTVPARPPQADLVAQQVARFSSYHASSRQEAAEVLGRMGDPRAVPALVERLKLDGDKSVRIAAANAIAQIGDPKSAIYLERASIYDKKEDVRNAAAAALARMPREVVAPQASSVGVSSRLSSTANTGPTIPPLDSSEVVPPPPTPSSGIRR